MIRRDPDNATTTPHDLIVIGGGIYGVMLALSAAQRGLRALLLERDDFGGATSHNSLRIIHGGLRYLQTADLRRFRESVRDRRWFLQNFPELIRPLPCLMPLYNEGLRRALVLQAALAMNNLLSRHRNRGVTPANHLRSAEVITAGKVRRLLPAVDAAGLKAGAIWYDAWMPDSQRVLMEALHWACELGATAINYVEALRPATRSDKIVGIHACDLITGREHAYRSPVIINATGPWCAELARRFSAKSEFVLHHSIAWNVLFDRPPPSDHAVAVTPRKRGGQTYFLLPWKGKTLAGTGHASWSGTPDRPVPSRGQLEEFIAELRSAVPALGFDQGRVLRVFAGLLPATGPRSAQLTVREMIHNHAADTGIEGLWTVCGVKFTTSRSVAERVLNRIFPRLVSQANTQRPRARQTSTAACGAPVNDYDYEWLPPAGDDWRRALRRVVADEAVQHLDDLVLRRTSLGDNAHRAFRLSESLCELFDWTQGRRELEVERLRTAYATDRNRAETGTH